MEEKVLQRVQINCNVDKDSKQCVCQPPFRLYAFPTAKKDKQMREKWKKLINRTDSNGKMWSPSKDSRVCSDHFQDGKPTAKTPFPVLKLGYKDAENRVKRMNFFESPKLHGNSKPKIVIIDLETNQIPDPPVEDLKLNNMNIQLADMKSFQDCLSIFFLIVCLRNYIARCVHLTREVHQLKLDVNNLKKQLQHHKKNTQSVSEVLLKTDADVAFFTGIPNKELFNSIHGICSPNINRYWKGLSSVHLNIRKFVRKAAKFGPRRKLPSHDELLLTLMKIRLGLLNKDLASRFQISESQCSRIFFAWLKALSSILGSMVFIPNTEELIATKPDRFRHLPDLHSIIDCTEFFIETPKDLHLQSATWSDYKHHNTVKTLVVCSPNSSIIYVSKLIWGGCRIRQ
ncbi:hypothetical protein ScPMuIL_000921 [Solemya velum]